MPHEVLPRVSVNAGYFRRWYGNFTVTDNLAIAPTAGLLITVRDQQGRTVQFQYEQPSGASAPRIKQITDPTGRAIAVDYDANNNLSQFTWPGGKIRQYLYERSDIPWAVTGIIDENTKRLATYGYDAQGHAIDTQWAGGADHYNASYAIPPSWNIVETYDSTAQVLWRDHTWQVPMGLSIIGPNGSTSSVSATLVQGMPYLTGQDQPAGSGCAATSSARTYDPNGNVASADDFNQHRTCYAYDLGRNLESTRVEGLSNTATCDTLTAPNAVLPAGSRKVSTAWHPNWRLPAKVSEPGKLTTYVYNGQGASCATGAPTLPDGSVIAVLCSKTEQATTDVNGSQGLNATIDTTVPARVWTYTYDQYGQVLTANGPRTDVNDTTTYTYYPSTSFSGTDPNMVGHAAGDLQSVTNAAGKVTQYALYDKAGHVLTMIDPNQVATTMTYWPRGWLHTTTVGGQTTTYDYWPTGLLKQVTQPDTSFITYTYDDAHRLTDITDNLGNTVHYELDNAGNRFHEQYKDPSHTLSRQLDRIIDALGRVQQTTGRE